jgi:hypothetical protein
MKRSTLTLQTLFFGASLLAFTPTLFAQNLEETKAVIFYEHHSSDMTGRPFGNDANGSQSAYDFVNKKFFNSFNEATFGAYTQGEEANIDMVEHAGPFGSSSRFLGFTSGVSTIWNGQIKGNGTTRWMKAPTTFNYDNATLTSEIVDAYKASSATNAVAQVMNNEVYIGRIRNSSVYVAIKCYNVRIPSGNPDGQRMDNVSFTFDYKIGSTGPATGIAEAAQAQVSVYPKPATDYVTIALRNGQQIASLKLHTIAGTTLNIPAITNDQINISALPTGLYFAEITTTSGEVLVTRIIRQ